MAGSNADFGNKGKTFGKIVLGILIFIILLIYIYHHPSNQAPQIPGQ